MSVNAARWERRKENKGKPGTVNPVISLATDRWQHYVITAGFTVLCSYKRGCGCALSYFGH